MPIAVRFMRQPDILQVKNIDSEAFPTDWPPTNFSRELQNKLAYYAVAYEAQEGKPRSNPRPVDAEKPTGFFDRVRKFFSYRQTSESNTPEEIDTVVGYAGLWIMADEAHITSIASHGERRHKGIGEVLLICLIELAMSKNARIVTLEARISNEVAQNLYYKFGFDKLGVRKGYYLDNKEDAVIMSTEYIGSPSFKEKFRRAKEAYLQKYGPPANELLG